MVCVLIFVGVGGLGDCCCLEGCWCWGEVFVFCVFCVVVVVWGVFVYFLGFFYL